MGCWEFAVLVLIVVFLFPKPFLRYISSRTGALPLPQPALEPAADPWVDARIDEERRLWRQSVPVWLGAALSVLAGAFAAWLGARKGWAPAIPDSACAGLGVALAGLGAALERRLPRTSLTLKGAGFALLALAAMVAVSFQGVLPPILGLVFLAFAGWVATQLLGRRSGLLATVIGLFGGVIISALLRWGGLGLKDVGSFLGLLAVMAALTLGWRRAWLPPILLGGAGLLLGTGMSGAWAGTPAGWLSCATIAACFLALGRLEPYLQGFAWIGAGLGVALISAAPLPLPLDVSPAGRFGLGLLLAGAAALAQRGATRPARWTALSAIASLVLFAILAEQGHGAGPGWSVLALGASLLYLGGTWLASRRAPADSAAAARRTAALPLAVATAAFTALAMALAIGPVWPGIAAALLVPLTVVLLVLFQAPDLGMLALLLGLFPLGWIPLHAQELRFPGGPEDLPWVLYGFGVPFLALVAAAWVARRAPVATLAARRLTWLAVMGACLLAAFAERQGVRGARTAEIVMAALAPLIAFLAFRRLGRMNAQARQRAAGVLLVALGALGTDRTAAAEDWVSYTRTLDVPAAGWIRVTFELPNHVAPGSTRITGPDGGIVRHDELPDWAAPELRRRTAETSASHPDCRPAGMTALCSLNLPPFRNLRLEVAGRGWVQYRLYDPERGFSSLETERVYSAGSLHLSLKSSDLDLGGLLILELAGSEGPPRLLSYRFERLEGTRAETTLTFRAGEPGRYLLTYGPDREVYQVWSLPPAGAEVREVLAGPEQVHQLPPLPAAAAVPGAPLAWLAFAAAWPVRAPGARPGDVVRLTVPDEVYARYGGYYGDLKVASGKREVAYQPGFRREGSSQVLDLHGARPQPAGRAGVSRIDLPLPAGGHWTAIHLRALPAVFSRKVELTAGNSVLASADWTCRPEAPLPCALDLEAPNRAQASPLSLRFLDGDDPPLKAVDVAIWKRSDQLIFVWPEGGPVEIVTGAESTDYRTHDQALEIDSRPWRTARVEVSRDDRREVAIVTFILAAGMLLGLLAWRRRLAVLVLAGLAALSLPAAGQEGRTYTRPVEVTAAGWVRVPLDLTTLGRFGEDPEGVQVLAPDGKEIARRLEPDDRDLPSLGPVTFSSSQKDGKNLAVVGPAAGLELPNGRILLETGGMGLGPVPGTRIEESLDGSSWQTLGEQDLFEVWKGGGYYSRAGLLENPPGHRRFLRVTLPSTYGFQFAEVVAEPPVLLRVPIERPVCASAGLVTTCRLPLPARGQRPVRLAIELAERGPVGLRLYAAQRGSWQFVAQGESRPAGARHEIPIALKALAGGVLRLEMQGKDRAPRLVAAALELAQPAVLFRAPAPGRYLLRYGDGSQGRDEKDGASAEVQIPPGPESSAPLPPLPEGLGRPAVALDGRHAAAWQVTAPGAKPGDVVRLEIPAEVYRRSLNFGRDLRLDAAGLQLPHLRQVADEPALAGEFHGLRPGHSSLGLLPDQMEVPLRQESLPLTTYQLTSSSSRPFHGWVVAIAGERSLESADGAWDCFPLPLLPCRRTATLSGWDTSRSRWPPLRISAERESSPYDLTLWRRRDILVFLWPRQGSVRLLAGSGADAPSYDLELLPSEVLARPWRAGELGPQEPEVPLSALVLVAAGCAVLVLLWQVLAGRPVARRVPKRG